MRKCVLIINLYTTTILDPFSRSTVGGVWARDYLTQGQRSPLAIIVRSRGGRARRWFAYARAQLFTHNWRAGASRTTGTYILYIYLYLSGAVCPSPCINFFLRRKTLLTIQ